MDKRCSERFPRRLRILGTSDYRAIYEDGQKVASRRFVLFVRRNRLGHLRLGITVSRRIGKAVVRNRIKRLLREVFRRAQAEIPDSFDLVVNATQGCAGARYDSLHAEFLAAVQKAARLWGGA
ncbi:MAG: ribonuclease P protein component [Acidobacteria bacterium]|nr:ribonuclease P protein component [Acidobacteriota bacterium]